MQRISSLKEVAEVAKHDGAISHALRDFLDGFYSEPSRAKVSEEPEKLASLFKDYGTADAYLAAVCDHLCRKYQLERPDWIWAEARFLKKPYFAAKTHPLRMIYLQESPAAFKERNIFVSENALMRA